MAGLGLASENINPREMNLLFWIWSFTISIVLSTDITIEMNVHRDINTIVMALYAAPLQAPHEY